MRGTWQTTGGGGGGGAGTVIGLIVAAVVAVAVLGPVVRAAVSLLETLVIVVAVLAGALLLAAACFAVWRLRHRSPSPVAVPWAVGYRPAARELPALPAPALEQPRVVHLHFHNVSPEGIAAITARHAREDDPR